MIHILKSIAYRIRHAKWNVEQKRQTAEFKNFISRAKRRREIKRCFKVFFKEVEIRKCTTSSQDILVKCSGIYLNRANQKDVIGYHHHFATERDKAYTIYHFMHAYLFCNYGAMLHDPSESKGSFLFHVYYAYRKGEQNKCRH